MGHILYISWIRFSIQLLTGESVFFIGKPKRDHFALRVLLAVIAHVLLASGYFYLLSLIKEDVPIIQVCFWIGLFFLTMCEIAFCFDVSPLEVLFIGTGGYATEHISYAIAKIIQYATGMYATKIGVIWENLIFRFLIYIIVAIFMYFAIVKKNRTKEEFKVRDIRLVQMALIILFSAIVLSVYASTKSIVSERSILSEIICPMYSLLCSFLVIMMEYYVFRENRLNREKETMEQLLQVANTQHESSREAIDIINIKCHDLKHQMKQLMKMEDAKERSEYIQEMSKAVSIYDATYHTGCETLDYILREKTLLSDEHKIAFSCMVDGSAISFMNTADIYALMGNALDNALEGVMSEEKEKRIISLRIQRHERMVAIHLENTCSKMIAFKEGLPVTSKEDKNYHGFGVKSISYIAKKYQGEALMRVHEGRFYLDVLLPFEPQMES